MTCALATLLLYAFTGASCGPDPTARQAAQPIVDEARANQFFAPDAQAKQQDAVPVQNYLTQLTIYRITLPAGAVSASEEFWKRVDEHAVDVGTYELLFKNGVRVGVAPAEEWDYFKDLLDRHPAQTQPMLYTGRAANDIELEMRKGVGFQNIMYYDAAGELVGRTYERCNDLIRLSYEPAPRKHGFVRIGLVPVVQSRRESLVPVGPLNTRSVTWFRPETLYELNLMADVHLDHFLIVAPSAEARWPSSLGNVFLTDDAATQRTETLIIIRPMVYRQRPDRADETPATRPAAAK